MLDIITAIFAVILIVGFIIATCRFWEWYYGAATSQDETLYFTTEDNWRLAVHHYKPREIRGQPVILCHGLSSNRYSWELPGGPSLAKYLSDQGRDVWVPELRGSGMSDHPGLFISNVSYDWDFDDHLNKDVESIIEFVLSRTGARKVHWVGHSMGGMLILAHLGLSKDPRIASATAIGSPTDFSAARTFLSDALLRIKPAIAGFPFFPFFFAARLITPVINYVPDKFIAGFNTANMEPSTARRAIALAAQLVTSNKIWMNFGRFIETGRFETQDGRPYLADLPTCKTPMLIVAGTRDNMAPAASVNWICRAGNENLRKCVTLGKQTGFSADYGHMDLIVGKKAEEEVFPLVRDFIGEND
jgi:pimeloyl-ACP methyl ester carboxylesterase